MKRVILLGVTATLAIGGIAIAPVEHANPRPIVSEPLPLPPMHVSYAHTAAKLTSRNYTRLPVPKEKPVVKAEPKPKPKVQVVHKKVPIVKYYGGMWAGATSAWKSVSATVRQDAVCVVHHESWSAGLYAAENPTSTASGVMQAIDSTGRAWMRAIGIKWRGHMSRHSHYEQDLAFIYGLTHSRGAWKSCR